MIVSNSYSQSEAFWFPEDLPINPLEYRLEKLGLKQIEIYQLDTIRYKNQSGIDTVIPATYMKYLICYDSLNRIKSINYNFRKHVAYEIMPDNKTVAMNFVTDSVLIHKLITLDSATMEFSSWRNEYHYFGTELDEIIIKKPSRVEDGVFIQERIIENTCIETKNENGLLIESKYYHDGILSWTLKYEYARFEKNGYSVKLPIIIIREDEKNKCSSKTIINYSL